MIFLNCRNWPMIGVFNIRQCVLKLMKVYFIYRFAACCFQALSSALSGLWQIDETDISGEIFSR